ncbi:hypothetical protein ACFWH1_18755 [Streptomyces sp. NPDC127037]|uniref:hypothetical protein n=1 Tax=Streptomyces sp. NPDC127037 TaxID=3347113 RepID=UPI00364851D3
MNHLVRRSKMPPAAVMGVITAVCLTVTLLAGCDLPEGGVCDDVALAAVAKPAPPKPAAPRPAVRRPAPLVEAPGGHGATGKHTSPGKHRHHGDDIDLCDD